jgi:hypothetical protein
MQAATSSGTTGSDSSTSSPNSWGGGMGMGGQHDVAPGLQYLEGLLGGSPASLELLGGEGVGRGFGGPLGMGQAGTSQQGSTSSSSDPSKTDLQKLQSDVEGILAKSQVTVAELTAVRTDFQKIASEATSPPGSTQVTTLANDVQALNGQLPTAAQLTQLQADYTAVLHSQGITDQSLINQVISDINAVVQSANITSADLATLSGDQTAIKNDLGTNGAGSATTSATGMPFPGPMGGSSGAGRWVARSGNGFGSGSFGRPW